MLRIMGFFSIVLIISTLITAGAIAAGTLFSEDTSSEQANPGNLNNPEQANVQASNNPSSDISAAPVDPNLASGYVEPKSNLFSRVGSVIGFGKTKYSNGYDGQENDNNNPYGQENYNGTYINNSSSVYISDLRPGVLGEFLNQEYINITNLGTTAVDLQNWTITDENANHTYIFPYYTLNSNSTVTIHTGNGTDNATTLYWNWTVLSFIWNSNGDTAYLYDSQGKLISTKCIGSSCNQTNYNNTSSNSSNGNGSSGYGPKGNGSSGCFLNSNGSPSHSSNCNGNSGCSLNGNGNSGYSSNGNGNSGYSLNGNGSSGCSLNSNGSPSHSSNCNGNSACSLNGNGNSSYSSNGNGNSVRLLRLFLNGNGSSSYGSNYNGNSGYYSKGNNNSAFIKR